MERPRQPLYIQIQEHFRTLIADGQLTADERIPAERVLMEQFGVSRITVANALSQLAKDGWIYRVPGRGSFVRAQNGGGRTEPPAGPQAGARGAAAAEATAAPPPAAEKQPASPGQAASGESFAGGAPDAESPTVRSSAAGPFGADDGRPMIGFIIPTLDDYFAIRLIRGINGVLNGHDCFVSIVLTHNDKRREREAIVKLVEMGAQGLIIFPIDAETYNEEILALKVRRYPFVLVDRYLPGVETSHVCADNFFGAQLAVDHLWALGHRSIAVCTDIDRTTVTVEERLRGYMEALKHKGAWINPALLMTDFPPDGEACGEALRRRLQTVEATAYITLNGKLGMRLAAAARQLGLSVPGDLSIVTFDDPSPEIDGPARYTHIAQSEEKIGRHAAHILLRMLEQTEREPQYHSMILEPRLVLGGTTGPPKAVEAAGGEAAANGPNASGGRDERSDE